MSSLAKEFHLIRLEKWAAFLFLPLLGALQAWSLTDSHAHTHGNIQILALAGFFLFLDGSRSIRQAFFRGWWFATCWLCSVFWWLFISMHVYGGLPMLLSAAAVVALGASLALYYAIAAALYWRMRVHGILGSALVFAACWSLAELARGQWFTGFPWGAIGYSHVDGSLAWLARWVGVYGIGAVAALLAALLALSVVTALGYILGRFVSVARLPVSGPHMASSYIWLLLISAAVLAGGHWQQRQFQLADAARPHHPPTTVALLQGNIPMSEKFNPETGVQASLEWYGHEFLTRKENLIIAPETAIPLLPRDLPRDYMDVITARYRIPGGQHAMLTGIPLGSATAGYTNSVEGFKPDSATYVYHKHHLVPFGEFVPPFFQWFNNMLHIPLDSFRRGAPVQPSFDWRGERFAPNICYEDLFGEELAKRFLNPKTAPTVLVNFSNLGWFGDGAVLDQHLQISRMRAMELNRPILRATNTGATAIIDHRGRVVELAPAARRYVLTGEVVGIGQDGNPATITPFARWAGKYGLLPVWLVSLLLLLGVPLLLRRLPYMRRS